MEMKSITFFFYLFLSLSGSSRQILEHPGDSREVESLLSRYTQYNTIQQTHASREIKIKNGTLILSTSSLRTSRSRTYRVPYTMSIIRKTHKNSPSHCTKNRRQHH